MAQVESNADQVARELHQNARDLVKGLQKGLQKWGNATVEKAKRRKLYTSRSHNLDKSQKADLDGLTLRIWIDPSLVTSGKYN